MLFCKSFVELTKERNKMLSNRRLVAACAFAICCNVTVLVLFVKLFSGHPCTITIGEHQHVSVVLPDDFLSIGIDALEVEHYDTIDFRSERLRQLGRALAPARLRLGGTMSERLVFSASPAREHLACDRVCHKQSHPNHFCTDFKRLCKHNNLPFFILTGRKWSDINEFCEATNMKLLFTFNVLLRDEHGWDYHNARDLLEYSEKHGYNVDWQLGNEPNSFHHVFNITVTPAMLALDFEKLRKLLNDKGYKHSLLVGPDTTRPQAERPECLKYMVEFLGNGSHAITARSWHQYYLNSRTATLEQFWNPDTFDLLKQQIETMKTHTAEYKHIPMWLTETSSSYGGGAPGLSNSYAGSPLWIDKLGLAARYNITTVVRQSFTGKHYGLIDENMEPLPDWWLSVLYKKVVGNKVLHIKCNCSRHLRMYAHCANHKYTNDTTAVTIYAINLKMEKVNFVLNGTALHGSDLIIDEFIVSAPSNNRKSKKILLNGWPLYYEHPLPDLEPRHHKYGNHIAMPPYSIGFWVIKNTSIKVCKN